MATILLIKEAIVSLKDRTGSSVIAINKFIESEKKTTIKKHIMKAALKRGVDSGTLVQVKNSYKVSPDAKKVMKAKKPVSEAKAKVVKKTTKKTTAPKKKASAKKATSSKKKAPAAKKTTVKKAAPTKKTASKAKVTKKKTTVKKAKAPAAKKTKVTKKKTSTAKKQ